MWQNFMSFYDIVVLFVAMCLGKTKLTNQIQYDYIINGFGCALYDVILKKQLHAKG